MPPKAEDDDKLLDVMKIEHSESSHRQDSSAKAKFAAFLQRIEHTCTLD